MKKLFSIFAALTMFCSAYGEQENEMNEFGVELNTIFNFALNDQVELDSPEKYGRNPRIDASGLECLFYYMMDSSNSINVRIGCAMGCDTVSEAGVSDSYYWGSSNEWEVQNYYIALGFRHDFKIVDSVDLFAGIFAGLVTSSAADSYYGYDSLIGPDGTRINESYSEHLRENSWGLYGGAEAGLTVHFDERNSLALAVQISCVELIEQPFDNFEVDDYQTSVFSLGIKLGYNYRF